jgi:hypothetical protein
MDLSRAAVQEAMAAVVRKCELLPGAQTKILVLAMLELEIKARVVREKLAPTFGAEAAENINEAIDAGTAQSSALFDVIHRERTGARSPVAPSNG